MYLAVKYISQLIINLNIKEIGSIYSESLENLSFCLSFWEHIPKILLTNFWFVSAYN